MAMKKSRTRETNLEELSFKQISLYYHRHSQFPRRRSKISFFVKALTGFKRFL